MIGSVGVDQPAERGLEAVRGMRLLGRARLAPSLKVLDKRSCLNNLPSPAKG